MQTFSFRGEQMLSRLGMGAMRLPTTSEEDVYKRQSEYSAVNMLKTEGGLYLSYAGGEPDAPQETSTPQGWASILTGEWGSVNGVLQHAPLSTACPTVLRELAQQGKTTAFLAEWDDHFTITYREEMAVAQRKGLPLSLIHI